MISIGIVAVSPIEATLAVASRPTAVSVGPSVPGLIGSPLKNTF
jgi:hypothetical protein